MNASLRNYENQNYMSKVKTSIGLIADSHLGYMQYSSPTRLRDFANGLFNAVKSMVESGVRAIVHAGDLFNASRPAADDVAALKEIHTYLIEHKIFCYTVTGNHDFSGDTSWLEIVGASDAGGFALLDRTKVSVDGVIIKGYPSLGKKELIACLNTDDNADVSILVLHQPVLDFIGFPSHTAIAMDEIPARFPVIAIGDLHIHDLRTRTNEDGSTGMYGYPGSTELCSTTEDPIKRWVELKFEGEVLADYQAHVFPTRPVEHYMIMNAGELDLAVDQAHTKATEIKSAQLVTPMFFIEFDTQVENVMPRIQQALSGVDALIIPIPRHVPVQGAAAKLAPRGAEVELSIHDILRLQLPASDALFQIAEQMINPDVDSKMALSAYIEQRLKPVIQNEQSE